MQQYTGAKSDVRSVLFLPGEPAPLAGVTWQSLYVWKIGQAEPIAEFPWLTSGNESGRSALIACSPDGRWLVGTTYRSIQVWDASSEVPTATKALDQEGLLVSGFGPSADEMLVIQRRPVFGVMRTATTGRHAFAFGKPTPFAPFPEWTDDIDTHLGWIRESICLSPDGQLCTGVTGGPEVLLWDTNTGAYLGHVRLRRPPNKLTFSPDRSLLALDAGTTVYIHNTKTFERVASWKAGYSYVLCSAWSPDNQFLARTDLSTTLRLYEVATGREVAALSNKKGRNASVAYSLDGLTCAVGVHNGTIRVWDVG